MWKRVSRREACVYRCEAPEGAERIFERDREALRELNAQPERPFQLAINLGAALYDP